MRFLKKLYNWTLKWADTRYGFTALNAVAFAESSFFPLPPDILLIALCISQPKKSFKFASYCSFFSVVGGVFGYFIGLLFFDIIGMPILNFYHVMDKYELIQAIYQKYDAIAVIIAGFSPLPYKVFSIAAGVCKINLFVFITSSIIGRSLRFLLLGWLIYKFGEKIKVFIDKYFTILTIAFTILLISGFWAITHLLK